MIIDGVKAGQLARVNVKTANDLFYSFLECAIFRLVVLRRSSVSEIKESIALAVKRLRID
jgi:hypothetical protein